MKNIPNNNSNNNINSQHRYLDVMTLRSFNGNFTPINAEYQHKSASGSSNIHSNLLIDPIVLPSLAHTGIDSFIKADKDIRLFYTNGEKNVNMARLIETSYRYFNIIKYIFLKLSIFN